MTDTPPVDSKGAAIDELINDIIALGTDHPNGAFPDGKKRDGTFAVQNEEEAKQAILAILAQEVNKARIEELKRCLDWEGHEPFILDRLKDLERLG